MVDGRFGVLVGRGGSGTTLLPSLPTDVPMTLYVALKNPAPGDRVNVVGTGSASAVLSTGSTTSGADWFTLAMDTNGTANVASTPAAPRGSIILCATRTQYSFAVQTPTTYKGGGVTSWPKNTPLTKVEALPSVVHWELWYGASHGPDVRAGIMARLQGLLA